MIYFLMFVLSNAGIAYIITQSRIFVWLRNLSKKNAWMEDLFKCPLCIGWWSSIYTYTSIYNDYNLNNIFIFNCIGSITSYMIYLIIKKL